MLLVKTTLKEIKGKGISLIADQEIKQGQAVYTRNSIIDIWIKKEDIPKEAKDFFKTYAVDKGGDSVLINIDNARFLNHSDKPNIKWNGKNSIALCKIHKGEEITINYHEIDVNELDF
jgi:hypothetical protein